MWKLLRSIFGSAQERRLHRYRKDVQKIRQLEAQWLQEPGFNVAEKTKVLQERYHNGESLDALMCEAYANHLVACHQLEGYTYKIMGHYNTWQQIPYDVQLLGAIALHKREVAEMRTGEGKTLTATLPLYLHALTNQSVHLATVNDYLAQRDCEWNAPLFEKLGITCGALVGDLSPEKRRAIYQKGVVYGSASEFGFDYLRDHSLATTKEEQVQTGHGYSIIDEIDSVLIDEARTPLIISGPAQQKETFYEKLKEPIAQLIKQQKKSASTKATKAWKLLSALQLDRPDHATPQLSQEQKKQFEEAVKLLWTISKSAPRQKILKRAKEIAFVRDALDQFDIRMASQEAKEERSVLLSDMEVLIDERNNDYELTDKGMAAWQEYAPKASHNVFEMIDLTAQHHAIKNDAALNDTAKQDALKTVYEEDLLRKECAHNLRQLLRAHLLMERDIDYIVQEDKIVIIDENTGRPQPGRRYSQGLHQALEAKENVAIQPETKTYASITLQNYFKIYQQLAGMSGTAATEAREFKEVYQLDVLTIPPNRPCRRHVADDLFFVTERQKLQAVANDIAQLHATGRPILVGVESVEASEKLSYILKRLRLPHHVLNAKHHHKEADIIAQAGQKGAITVATNMAGRGTDIKLGPGVNQQGGLHIIGCSRQTMRRSDDQLQGRGARQGDEGSVQFYVCAEDTLFRLFSVPMLRALIQQQNEKSDAPVRSSMIAPAIRMVQERLEHRHYNMRRRTLDYDNAISAQREEVYRFRQQLIDQSTLENVAALIPRVVAQLHARGENPTSAFPFLKETASEKQQQELQKAYENHLAYNCKQAGIDNARMWLDQALRSLFIRIVDEMWQHHLHYLEHIKSDVALRAVAQKDPLLEFKQEAFESFDNLCQTLSYQLVQAVFRTEINHAPVDSTET